MAYIRHRSRMVRQSVWNDLNRLLGELNWTGATPLGILESKPLVVTDYFPEDYATQGVELEPNLLAMSTGTPGAPYQYEMGGIRAQDYTFRFMLICVSDAMAQALLQDLSDRYMGESESGAIPLYNYNAATPQFIVNLETDSFRFGPADEQVAAIHPTYYGVLDLTDFLDGTD